MIFEKAAKSEADIVFLDLEDSVPLNEKKKQRLNVIEAVNDINWNNKTLSIRVNANDTDFFEKDIEEILKNTSDNLDLLMFPKVNSATEIFKSDKIVSGFEKNLKEKNKIGF